MDDSGRGEGMRCAHYKKCATVELLGCCPFSCVDLEDILCCYFKEEKEERRDTK